MEQNFQAIEQTIRLVAKTGLFFASLDGDYSQGERNFIDNYKNRLAQVGPVSDVQQTFDTIWDHPITLQEVINDTRALLDLLPTAGDKQAVVATLAHYIQQVIWADGNEHPAERDAAIAWLNALA
ncbi:MAG: TerB family tellurite resistance protein [Muribaculaceae bacterium]|nr:TerB family tellurite resistance protein [Muribaculaceae bacterium]